MGIIFKGKVWGKIRPMIQIRKNNVEFHAGISHSQKEGMIKITASDLKSGTNLPLFPQPFAGLCNKSKLIIGLGEIGETTADFDEKLLQANPKLREKIEKRQS